jgi:hypothetical protein
MRRYDTIPGPHVFRIDTPLPAVVGAGQDLTVSLVLVGAANRYLDLVRAALATAGEGGLGPHRSAGCGSLSPGSTPE